MSRHVHTRNAAPSRLLRPAGFDELGLRRAVSDRMLPFLVGAMAFLAALALGGWVAAASLAQHWRLGAAAAMTVQVPHPADPAAQGGGNAGRRRCRAAERHARNRRGACPVGRPGGRSVASLARQRHGAAGDPAAGGGAGASVARWPGPRRTRPPPRRCGAWHADGNPRHLDRAPGRAGAQPASQRRRGAAGGGGRRRLGDRGGDARRVVGTAGRD